MSDIANGFIAVTPSDTVNITQNTAGQFPRAFRFGTGGTVSLVGFDGSIGAFTNVANGETIYAGGKRINATGTTATNIVGLYL